MVKMRQGVIVSNTDTSRWMKHARISKGLMEYLQYSDIICCVNTKVVDE